MTVAIGRFGRDITTPAVASIESSGRRLRLTGNCRATSLANAKTLRQQLLGLVDNPDEPVVPLACTDDTSLNGFYRVDAATVDLTVEGNDLANFVFPWSCELERAAPGYNPLLERTLVAGLRTNAHSIALTSTVAFFGIPERGVTSSDHGAFATVVRDGADDDIFFFYDDNPAATVYVNTWGLNPDSTWGTESAFYSNSALIESKWSDGSNYYAVTGRHVPARLAALTRPGHDWRISNGFVRVTPADTAGISTDGCDLNVEHWDGTQWDTAKRYTFTINAAALATSCPFGQFTVLRNDPAAVSIRLVIDNTGTRADILDITLRRGSRFIECRWSMSTAKVAIVARASVEAATALTGGIQATSNDASGNRYVLAGAQATTNDLVNGKITSGTVTAYDFMIGSEVGGSGATGQATAQNQLYQYYCAQAESYRIVGR